MSVIDLHPEELFDKLALGTLSEAEGERLRAHLETCEVCRFELALRADFRDEDSRRREPSYHAPQALTIAPVERRGARSRARNSSARSRGRIGIWLGAAALCLVAGGAFAAWSGVAPSGWFEDEPEQFLDPPTRHAANAPSQAAPAPAPSQAAPGPAPSGSADGEPIATTKVGAPSPAVRQSRRIEQQSSPANRAGEPTSAAKLFRAANRARKSGETARAIMLYRRLQHEFPSSSEATLSELTLATLLLDGGDGRGALVAFDAYLARGESHLEAEALVGRALAFSQLGNTRAEVLAWRTILERHPGSSYARRARERLSALGQL